MQSTPPALDRTLAVTATTIELRLTANRPAADREAVAVGDQRTPIVMRIAFEAVKASGPRASCTGIA